MRQSPYSLTARAMDDPTRYDVILQLQERVEVSEERDAQRDGEMDTMRILQRLERRKRLPLTACFEIFYREGLHLGVPGGEGDANREGIGQVGSIYLFINKKNKKSDMTIRKRSLGAGLAESEGRRM